MGLPWWLRGKGAWKAGDRGSNPGSERSPGGGHRNPLQYSCLGDPRREEPGGLQSVQLQRAGQDLSDWTTTTNVLKCNFSNEWNEPIHYRFGKDKMWYKDQPPLCSLLTFDSFHCILLFLVNWNSERRTFNIKDFSENHALQSRVC